jgi:DNA-binding MarR family transcriptional regulator
MFMAIPGKKDELRYGFWLLLHNTQGLIAKSQKAYFRKQAGVFYPQFLVLMTVASSERPVTETEIARQLQRNLNSISMIIDRMVKQGLVTRAKSERDRRLTLVKLTEKGKETLALGKKTGGTLLQRLTQPLTIEEIQTLSVLLRKLRDQALRELGQEVETDDKMSATGQTAKET